MLFIIAWLIFGFKTRILVPMLALIPLTTAILVYFTWLYTCVEYEFSVISGILTVTKIYGNRRRRKLLDMTIRDASCIAPANRSDAKRQAESYRPEKTVTAISSQKSPDVYIALFEDKNEKKTILYFEPDEKLLKLLKFYNSSTIIPQK